MSTGNNHSFTRKTTTASDDSPATNNNSSVKKTRLLVGEGDFSFTDALLEKHAFTREEIIATELRSKEDTIRLYKNDGIQRRLRYLEKKPNVTIQFEIDATQLHVHYKRQQFHRVYFNFPCTDILGTLKMLRDFFQSAAKVQDVGHRVLLTLVCLPGDEKKTADDHRKYWHGYVYGMVNASQSAGYRLIQKRRFNDSEKKFRRYGNKYVHRLTYGPKSSKHAKDARQYVFEREQRSVKYRENKIYKITLGSTALPTYPMRKFEHFQEAMTTDTDATDTDATDTDATDTDATDTDATDTDATDTDNDT
ncbi:unnamed protein product [Rotaria socialis]|uniref:25S rRNA (uridine-N(3))-methyltransferase BMT5-like domain-containing protein n=1 Tax=Rotaria socialis TaxID=392032 RepID=A0A817R6Y0_9BILA|nr:unnamed protein product [Rotaria socialis]CAF4522054.1 unnamed protein product [Rotaria socialis]